jgi:DNA-binding HxlR family transcriptional regulator
MPESGYRQFCPVAMAAELLCTRWTVLLLRELIAGSTRFNELRRGVPTMSPTLLSQRLKELESAGVIERHRRRTKSGMFEYRLTTAGEDLRPVIEAMGFWGQRWIEAKRSLRNLDPMLLMWDMRRNLEPTPLPRRRVVLHFSYPEQPASRRDWWLVVGHSGEVELETLDPGFSADLHITTDLRTMTAIWMGLTTIKGETKKLQLLGEPRVAGTMQRWLGLSPFAVEPKRVAG